VLLALVVVLPSAAVLAAEKEHRVAPGESASGIAKRYYGNFESTSLMLLYNGREDPVIRPGEKLRVPHCEVHVVKRGDSWSSLAKRYLGRVSAYEAVALLNGLIPDAPLRPGQRIAMPVGLRYELKRGESLAGLAKRFHGDARMSEAIRIFNDIDDPRRLSVGQRIEIPLVTLFLAEEPKRSARSASPPKAVPRFNDDLSAAKTAYDRGEYDQAAARLAAVRSRVESEGSLPERMELLRLSAFLQVAFDRTDRACEQFRSYRAIGGKAKFDPDLVSPKIRKALAGCEG